MKKKLLALLLALAICLSCVAVCADGSDEDLYSDLTQEEKEQLNELMFSYYKSVVELIRIAYNNGEITAEEMYESFIKEIIGTDPEMVESAVRAALELLDDNSFYMSRKEYEEYFSTLQANYCGIGVLVTSMNGPIMIVGYTAEKTPAKTAGLLPGDAIISVNGEDITGKSSTEVGELIKGEKGTAVKIGIKRNNMFKEYDVVRGDVEQNPVSYEVMDDRMYIKLSVFSDGSSEKMAEALKIADARGIKKIILDLRDNGGGIGTEAFEIASMFLPKDKLITTIEYKDSSLNEIHISTADFKSKKYVTVVLVNEGSASCSEMVAGALQDHELGYLIGNYTYGKSTGQSVYPLDALGGYLKLTVSQYCTPSGNPIPDDGIIPDRYIENQKVPLNKSGVVKKMTFERKPSLGDSGDDIIACKERLNIIGYYVGDTQKPEFDLLLESVVKKFQSDNGLYSYGVLDNATMLKLYNITNELEYIKDTQLEAANEYLDRK